MAEKQLYMIKNTLKNPIVISYKGEGMRLSPRQKQKRIDRDQLGAIPRGVILIPMN
jgi:hypothetical protein